MRDYSELMNMTPAELVSHALECAKLGVLSASLVEALAHQLETADAEATQAERLREKLEGQLIDALAECLREEMNRTYG